MGLFTQIDREIFRVDDITCIDNIQSSCLLVSCSVANVKRTCVSTLYCPYSIALSNVMEVHQNTGVEPEIELENHPLLNSNVDRSLSQHGPGSSMDDGPRKWLQVGLVAISFFVGTGLVFLPTLIYPALAVQKGASPSQAG